MLKLLYKTFAIVEEVIPLYNIISLLKFVGVRKVTSELNQLRTFHVLF
jgi:hypothetical protein